MHKRVDAATDVAMIGVWDAGRRDVPLAPGQRADDALLERDADAGDLFLIHTGGDGAGVIDVYVDQDVPPPQLASAKPAQRDFLIAVPTGRLVVAGAEDYRSATPRISSADDVIDVPAGDYRLRCYVVRGDHEEGGVSIPQLEETILTPDDRAYYRAKNAAEMRVALLGYPLFLLFPVLAFPYGWKIALAVTLAVVLPYFYIFGQRSERARKADVRWQRINKALQDAMLNADRATLLIQLSRISSRDGLRGGALTL